MARLSISVQWTHRIRQQTFGFHPTLWQVIDLEANRKEAYSPWIEPFHGARFISTDCRCHLNPLEDDDEPSDTRFKGIMYWSCKKDRAHEESTWIGYVYYPWIMFNYHPLSHLQWKIMHIDEILKNWKQVVTRCKAVQHKT